VKIAQGLSEANIGVMDIITIITPVVRAGGNDLSEKELQKDVWEAGLVEGIRVCGEIIAVALGSDNSEGNEEKAETLL
jgi:hypothetical protein